MSALLGRKQQLDDQRAWRAAWERCETLCPPDELQQLEETAIADLRAIARGRKIAYGWSGGKDSLALQHIADRAGIRECALAISALEWPAFLAWATDNMPDGLTIINTGQDYAWLRAHPRMLFPHGADGPRWFRIVNQEGQNRYYHAEGLDLIALGRRRQDGNYCGPRGTDMYRNAKTGVLRYSPLADWSHEAVLHLLKREGMSLPPCYDWPRGWQVGTGAWPARQWTRSIEHGWQECWEIDREVVREAAEHDIPGAREHLDQIGES